MNEAASSRSSGGEVPRVLIVGGGVAAVEVILALHELASGRVEIACLTPEEDFVLRASSVTEPFERGPARRLSLRDLAARHRVTIHRDALVSVDPAAHVVTTSGGGEIPFDVLVLAVGARPICAVRGAVTFKGPGEAGEVQQVIRDLAEGRASSVAYVLPSESSWPLPMYELALMTVTELRSADAHATVTVVTPEPEPLAVFGKRASTAVRELLEARGVRLRTGVTPKLADEAGLVLEDGERIAVDRVVALPELLGPSIPGIPGDERGFIPVDGYGQVHGLAGVYAAGDATTFPLKQGGLAAQQADVVAQAIAARAGARVEPHPFHPVLRGLLLTGGVPLYMRAELLASGDRPHVAHAATSSGRALRGSASERPLWWPPAKVAGRLLGPYLAEARPNPLSSSPLVDRLPGPGARVDADEQADALELALLLADGDAECGDYPAALRALAAAQALAGVLPAEYEAKRTDWLTRAASRSVLS